MLSETIASFKTYPVSPTRRWCAHRATKVVGRENERFVRGSFITNWQEQCYGFSTPLKKQMQSQRHPELLQHDCGDRDVLPEFSAH